MCKPFACIVAFAFMMTITSHAHALNSDPRWQPDPAVLNQLAPETMGHGYALRPPLGYTLSNAEAGFAQTDIWRGTSHHAESVPEMVVVVIPPVLGIAVTQPNRAIGCYLHEVRRKVQSVIADPMQQGRVQGRLFWRVGWHGSTDSPDGPVSVQGFVYATREQGSVMLVGGHDTLPYADETLMLAEASALTIHRR